MKLPSPLTREAAKTLTLPAAIHILPLLLLYTVTWLSNLIPSTSAIQFNKPYILLLDTEPDGKSVLIKTDMCLAGGYTNVPVKLRKFCASGFWILISEYCNTETAQKYFLTAKDSCFEIPEDKDIKVKRFMPILQDMSDAEGYGFAWRDEAMYFVRLDPVKGTAMRPMDGPNKDWTIMTVNQHFYRRQIMELGTAASVNGSRFCYKSQGTGSPYHFYRMVGDRPSDSDFEPYQDATQCKMGYNVVTLDSDARTGLLYWIDGAETPTIPSTSSAYRLEIGADKIFIPAKGGKKTVACSDDSQDKEYAEYSEATPVEKYPEFPQNFPVRYSAMMVRDEIQETSSIYTQHKLFHTRLPEVNKSEYTMVQMSTGILQKFCCHEAITGEAMAEFKALFRLTMTYFQDYYPYEEPSDPDQNLRIFDALEMCANRSEPEPCITINATTTCPGEPNQSNWNSTAFPIEMPEDLKYEEGNIDYVTETIWKAMLFVHYFCASFFADPADHSAFETKIEGFFNPMVKVKWAMPQNAHRVYQLLLNSVNIKKFGETVDICVSTAHDMSAYKRWLTRPDIFAASRKKRAADTDSEEGGDCVPKGKPKVFCMKKQFDTLDLNLVQPKVASGDCFNSYNNRAKYKYIHAAGYDSSY